mgnify:FL=1
MIKKTKTTLPKKYNRVNIAGINIKRIRKEKYPDMSQNGLATQLQLQGIAINKNAIQRMEAGLCAINDIQLVAIAKILHVTIEDLLDETYYKVNYSQENEPSKNVAE